MKVHDLKWYSPFLFLTGAILSFADPITDILTLMEFYRTDHKIWFGVSLAFVILPSLMFSILNYLFRTDQDNRTFCCTTAILCGFHPFSAAFARLEGFLFCVKKWWRGDIIDSETIEKADKVLMHIEYAVLIESALESAPQFVIQLHAITVQEEPITIIQMISLPVSFLSLAWACTTTQVMFLGGRDITSRIMISDLSATKRIVLYLTNVLHLSSRLSAICYFTVSYKWWVIGVFLFHFCAIALRLRCKIDHDANDLFLVIFFIGLYWLRDDASDLWMKNESESLSVVMFCNFLFVLENVTMMVFYYRSPHSDTWFSLALTVCVCVFSVLGAIMRISLFRHLLDENAVHPFV